MNEKHLPTDPTSRKQIPLFTGLMKYFPDALVEVAHLSYVGNKQHNPGEPLHWAKDKSTDQEDTLMRHLLESGTLDTDGVRHSTKVAWRALALLQLEIEHEKSEHSVSPVTISGPYCLGLAPTSPGTYIRSNVRASTNLPSIRYNGGSGSTDNQTDGFLDTLGNR